MWLRTCSGVASRRGRKATSSLSMSAQLNKGHCSCMRSFWLSLSREVPAAPTRFFWVNGELFHVFEDSLDEAASGFRLFESDPCFHQQ